MKCTPVEIAACNFWIQFYAEFRSALTCGSQSRGFIELGFDRKKRIELPAVPQYDRTEACRGKMNSTKDYILGTHDEELERLGLQHRAWRERALEAWHSAGIHRASIPQIPSHTGSSHDHPCGLGGCGKATSVASHATRNP